jgi:predicted nucleic acid-binding protein
MDLWRGKVYTDANILIYAMEGHDTYGPALAKLLLAIEDGTVRGLTSELSLTEVLVGPLRDNDTVGCAVFELLLEAGSSLKTVAVDRAVLRRSAEIRATSRARLPDAIHLATAELMECEFFITEDRRIPVKSPLVTVRLAELDLAMNWTAP